MTGGWAKESSNCLPKNSDKSGLVIALAQLDANGNSKGYFWSGTSTFRTLGNIKNLVSKVLPDGVQCTIKILESSESSWGDDWARWDYSHVAREVLGIDGTNLQDVGPIAKILVGISPWEDTISSQLFEFKAGKPAAPQVSIVGLNRAETINFGKTFQVKVTTGIANKLQEKPYIDGSNGSFCGNFKTLSADLSEKNYESECVLLNDSSSLTRDVLAYVYTLDGRIFRSQPVAVNFTNSGIPKLSITTESGNYYAKESKPGKGTLILIKVHGNLQFDGGLQSISISDQIVNLCEAKVCQEMKLDENGDFATEFKTKNLVTRVDARMKIGALDLFTSTGILEFEAQRVEPIFVPFKTGMPKGKVDRKSSIYKTSLNFGRSFRSVSLAGETAVKQCNRAQGFGYILAYGQIQFLGIQAELIKSYLRTASGYQGCLDGFSK